MPGIQNKYKIISNEKITPVFYKLCFEAPGFVKKVCPGQFVNIKIDDGLEPFLRRPLCIYRAKKYVELFYEVVGKGTSVLSKKKKGEMLDVLGPLGNKFSKPSKNIKQVVMVAGGIGVAPFLVLSDELKKNKNIKMILLYGGRTKDFVFNMSEFKKNGCKVFVSTDDGSVGEKGRVSKLFPEINIDPKETFIYTCGPKPMMKAVQAFAAKHGIRGEVSSETVMACGVGACLGCVVKTINGYKTVCHDGPVFGLDEIIFD